MHCAKNKTYIKCRDMKVHSQSNFLRIDELIRSGNASAASSMLSAELLRKPMRSEAVQLAAFARRLGRSELGLRLLHPYVRGNGLVHPTVEERIEYAGNLIRLGLASEASSMLSPIDLDEHPQGLLFAAFSLNYEWQNKKASELFVRYCDSDRLTDYQRSIGQLNLSESLLRLREFGQADSQLEKLEENCRRSSNLLLLAVVFELKARSLMLRREFELAIEFNLKSLEIHKNSTSLDALSAKAQSCILQIVAARGKISQALRNKFIQIQAEAGMRRRFELVRDLFFWLTFLQPENSVTWNRLYLGTRHEGYRNWMCNQQPNRQAPPPEESLTFHKGSVLESLDHFKGGRSSIVPDFIFESNEGRIILSHPVLLKKSQSIHRLIQALVSDIFRPPTVPEIHAMVFPGEYFHPVGGPNRVHQLLNRARAWLKGNNVPLRIRELGSVYFLEAEKSLSLRRSSSSCKAPGDRITYEHLLRLNLKVFSANQIEPTLSLSKRQVQRKLKSLCEAGLISSSGSGPNRRYILHKH